ncbi:hypothetical protein [Reticulibacter mediterranei]|uniref:hypothetical protein n=1 Tax=Reticulibacter mediterranei TaxID=2778369 RepID=UPI001C6938FB|nr:hypothetical protein [Reticulibacter mediterranei]
MMILLLVQDAHQRLLASITLIATEYRQGAIHRRHSHEPARGEGKMSDRFADLLVSGR